jgi:hypothetical protein
MAIWSDALIGTIALKAELEIAKELGCIVDRFSLSVSAGENIYEVPSYCFAVRRVTWKGTKLLPISHGEAIQRFTSFKPNRVGAFLSSTYEDDAFAVIDVRIPEGKPRWYVYNTLGINAIMLFPAPSEALSSTSSNLWTSEIGNRLIVECARLADTSGNTYRIQSYFRRKLVKFYTLKELFRMEGKGQDLEAAAYYTMKYEKALKRATVILNGIFTMNNNEMEVNGPRVLARPQLPSNYGVIVR